MSINLCIIGKEINKASIYSIKSWLRIRLDNISDTKNQLKSNFYYIQCMLTNLCRTYIGWDKFSTPKYYYLNLKIGQ
jgi:hypothetical protein